MLLDTNAISAWAKGDAGLLQALRPDRTWYLPAIALGEYRYGLLKSTRRVDHQGGAARGSETRFLKSKVPAGG